MGYSSNPITVRKNSSLLEPLLSGRDYVWSNVPNPKAVAYKLRECIRIACLYPSEFPKLALLGPRYRISVAGGTVMAQFIAEGDLHLEEKDTALVLPNPHSDMAIIQFWLDQPEPKRAILVTDCSLSNQQLYRLERWAKTIQPAWRVVVQQDRNAIRLEEHHEAHT